MNQFEPLIKLPPEEEQRFATFVKEQREIHIKSPKETARIVIEKHAAILHPLLEEKQISAAIIQLRQLIYDEFLKEESIFNGVVLSEIGRRFEAPRAMLEHAAKILSTKNKLPFDEFKNALSEVFGNYTGNISPYIYQLCLSNTQSRRSRAGKTFEGIIYFLYEYYDFAFESQSSIGTKSFSDLKLGKVVDSILPSREAFLKARPRVIVGSMKTTLRERWQEVVEEISRSSLPNIYLLTVDDDISASKAKQMAQHNLILVVLRNVKSQAGMKKLHSVIDFETYFSRDIPDVLKYWKSHDSSH